jgi:hypothetical protein
MTKRNPTLFEMYDATIRSLRDMTARAEAAEAANARWSATGNALLIEHKTTLDRAEALAARVATLEAALRKLAPTAVAAQSLCEEIQEDADGDMRLVHYNAICNLNEALDEILPLPIPIGVTDWLDAFVAALAPKQEKPHD